MPIKDLLEDFQTFCSAAFVNLVQIFSRDVIYVQVCSDFQDQVDQVFEEIQGIESVHPQTQRRLGF